MHFIKATETIPNNKVNIFILKYFLIASYILIFVSLGSNIINTFNNYKNINNIYGIAGLRSIFPIIILIINFYYILKKKIELNKVEIIFISIILSYFIGSLIHFENSDYFKISFITNPLALITTHSISKRVLPISYPLGIFILFISSVLIFFYSQNTSGYGGGWLSIFGNKIIFINSNGASRLLCFINLLVLTSLIYNKNYTNIKSIISVLCIIILTSLVIKAEGRVNIVLALISCSVVFLNKNIFVLKKFLVFFSIIIFAFYLSKLGIANISDNYKRIFIFNDNKRFKFDLNDGIKNNIDVLFQTEIISDKNNYKTDNWNRFAKWALIIKEVSRQNITKVIFGSGPEHDRILLKSKGLKWHADAANGFLYSLLSGGILGALLYLLILKKIIYNLFIFFKKKIFIIGENYNEIFCFICPFLLILRSIFENGFSVWGVDFIIIVICLSYIESKYHLEN